MKQVITLRVIVKASFDAALISCRQLMVTADREFSGPHIGQPPTFRVKKRLLKIMTYMQKYSIFCLVVKCNLALFLCLISTIEC